MFMFICGLSKKNEELERKKKHYARVLYFQITRFALHGTQVYQARIPCDIFLLKIHVSTSFFFFMKLKCLKLDLDSKLEFHKLEFQKVVLHIL